MNSNFTPKKLLIFAALLVFAVGNYAVTAVAATTVTYTGQGFDSTDNRVINERCGLEGQDAANDGGTGQFALNGFTPGDPYLVWVLSANGAISAQLNLPDEMVDMFKVGGTFKYASAYYSLADLLASPVTATYEGNVKGKVQLVVSHGCAPFSDMVGAWCSPGYWKNASDAAWSRIGGVGVKSALFNSNVVPDFYDTVFSSGSLPAGPTILQALDSTGPGGANKYGSASDPYGLNAFNATAAYLTGQLPCNPDGTCYFFDVTQVGADPHNCPIDNGGNWKPVTP